MITLFNYNTNNNNDLVIINLVTLFSEPNQFSVYTHENIVTLIRTEKNEYDIPDVFVFLNINFVEHAVVTFARDVGLHFHSYVSGKY